MAPPIGYKYWDDYFREKHGVGWDKNIPGRTPDPEETESHSPYGDRDAEINNMRLISNGHCPIGSCWGEARTYTNGGDTVLVHSGTACEGFRMKNPNGHTGTKAMDQREWKNWAPADSGKREIELDTSKTVTTISDDDYSGALARYKGLEFK